MAHFSAAMRENRIDLDHDPDTGRLWVCWRERAAPPD